MIHKRQTQELKTRVEEILAYFSVSKSEVSGKVYGVLYQDYMEMAPPAKRLTIAEPRPLDIYLPVCSSLLVRERLMDSYKVSTQCICHRCFYYHHHPYHHNHNHHHPLFTIITTLNNHHLYQHHPHQHQHLHYYHHNHHLLWDNGLCPVNIDHL